jgi:hypothetical protein
MARVCIHNFLKTGPKTRKLLEMALGRVLVIDEAYRLSEGHFAKEAIDELVGLLTQETFRGKLIVILAGYDHEMNELLDVNPGLSSRFPDEIRFYNLPPAQLLKLLRKELAKKSVSISALDNPNCSDYRTMIGLMEELSTSPSWGNARDVQTLSKDLTGLAFRTLDDECSSSDDNITLSGAQVVLRMQEMLATHKKRHPASRGNKKDPGPFESLLIPRQAPKLHASTHVTQAEEKSAPAISVAEGVAQLPDGDSRDPDVSDAVWTQLQLDKALEEEALIRVEKDLGRLEDELKYTTQHEEELGQKQTQLDAKHHVDDSEDDELKRQREQARLRELEAKASCARIEKELGEKRQEEQRRRKEEAKVQAKLRKLGVCVAGFRWIKQSAGYRCAGGSHFIDNASLGISD